MLEFFGQFLVRTKVISVEQLRDALDMMSRENLLLGQLAVEEGYLSGPKRTRSTESRGIQTSLSVPSVCKWAF